MKNILLFAMAVAIVLSCTLEKTMPISNSNPQAKVTSVDEKQEQKTLLLP